jgi:hypothetical protein
LQKSFAPKNRPIGDKLDQFWSPCFRLDRPRNLTMKRGLGGHVEPLGRSSLRSKTSSSNSRYQTLIFYLTFFHREFPAAIGNRASFWVLRQRADPQCAEFRDKNLGADPSRCRTYFIVLAIVPD